jgi:ankyrin repeat protein
MSDPFSIAAGVIAVLQLAQSLGLFAYGLNERPELCRRLASDLAGIEGLMGQLQRLEKTLGSREEWISKASVLQDLLVSLQDVLDQLQALLRKVSTPHPGRLAMWPVHEKAIKGLLDAIERYKTSILLQIQLEQADLCRIVQEKAAQDLSDRLELVSSNVSQLLRQTESFASDEKAYHQEEVLRLARKEHEATLAWLTNVSFVSDHNFCTQKWVPGTTKWFFEQPTFQKWRESISSQVLLITGYAGCGKTLIASQLIEYLRKTPAQDRRPPLAYVYCSSKQPAKADPATLIASLIQQLCHESPVINESVVQLREQYRRLPNAEPSLGELAKVLRAVVKSFTTECHIVIDGLDECAEPSKLAEAVNRLTVNQNSHVRLAIFCRSTSPVWPVYFADVPQINIGPTLNGADIELFARTQLDRLASSNPVLRRPDLRSHVVQTLLTGADGMFLWVHLQAENLRSQPTEKLLRKALMQLPKGIEQVFKRSLQRIEEQSEETRQLAVKALTWAMNARRPLHVSEMLEAIAVEDDLTRLSAEDLVPESQLMAYCADLITLDSKGYAQLLHSSLKTVLENQSSTTVTGTLSALRGTEKAVDYDLATICVQYLSLENFSDIGTSSLEVINEVCEKHPFIQYAACNWAWHARRVRCGTEELHRNMLRLLSDRNRMDLILRINHLSSGEIAERTPRPISKRNALHFIAQYGLIALYDSFSREQLQDLSSSVDSSDQTPLDLALSYQRKDLSEKLLDLEGWQNKSNSHRLHLAVENGWTTVVEKLLSLRARLDMLDDRGLTPLQVSCLSGRSVEMVRILLNAGSDIDEVSSDGNTSVMVAAGQGKTELVEYLLQQGADFMVQTDYGQTALHMASSSGHLGAVKLLLAADQRKELIHYPDKYNETPIFDAVEHGYAEIMELLLRSGAQRHHPNTAGVTPLHVAVAYQQYDIFCRLIVESGDLFHRDAAGWSPLDVLRETCDPWIGLDVFDSAPSEARDLITQQLESRGKAARSLRSTMSTARGQNSNMTHDIEALIRFTTRLCTDAVHDSDLVIGEYENTLWQRDKWGRTAYDLAIGQHHSTTRSCILSMSERPPGYIDTFPELVDISNQQYLQKPGVNFCLFVVCEICKEHIDQCHWVHCKLCSKLGEGWDICERCFRDSRDNTSLCPSGHDRADLQLLFIANHMISGPMTAFEDLCGSSIASLASSIA